MDFFPLVDTILENSFIPLYGITLMLSIICYSKYYDTSLRYIPVLLLYTLLNELLGHIISRNEEYALIFDNAYNTYTVVIYNIYNVFFFSYFFYLFWIYLKNKKHRDIIRWGGILFLTTALINPFFQSIMLRNQIYAYVIGAVVLIITIVLYWREIVPTTTWTHLKNNILFWLSLGLFIFYTGYLPIKINRHFHIINQTNEAPYVRRIQLLLIVIMYGCFIVGFWRMKRRLVLMMGADQNDHKK